MVETTRAQRSTSTSSAGTAIRLEPQPVRCVKIHVVFSGAVVIKCALGRRIWCGGGVTPRGRSTQQKSRGPVRKVGAAKQIDFVSNYEHVHVVLGAQQRHLLQGAPRFLVEPPRRVHYEQYNVALWNAVSGSGNESLHVAGRPHAARGHKSGGVRKYELRRAPRGNAKHTVARGIVLGGDRRYLATQDAIQQRRLPRVGGAHDRNCERALPGGGFRRNPRSHCGARPRFHVNHILQPLQNSRRNAPPLATALTQGNGAAR